MNRFIMYGVFTSLAIAFTAQATRPTLMRETFRADFGKLPSSNGVSMVKRAADTNVSVAPKPGAVQSLQTFNITFVGASSVEKANLNYDNAPYVIKQEEGATKNYCFTVNCEGNVLTVGMTKEITEEGNYTLHLPAGFYSVDGVTSTEELIYDYIIGGETTELSISVLPEPGVVQSLQTFNVTFIGASSVEKANLNYDNAPYVIKQEEGATKNYCFTVNCEGNILTVGMTKQIVEEGNYTLHLPAGFYSVDGVTSTEELIYDYTIGNMVPSGELILEAPAGERVDCQTNFLSWFPTVGGLWGMPLVGKPTHYIIGEDGNLYLYNPVITDPYGNKFIGSYLKAENKDGKFIAQFPQPIYFDPSDGGMIYMDYTYDDGETYVIVEQPENFVEFVIDDKKNCRAVMPQGEDGSYALSAMNEEGVWQFFGNVRMEYKFFDYCSTPLPENPIVEDWTMEYYKDGSRQSRDISVVFEGEELWVQGFSDYCDEEWAHAVISGDSVTFDPYLGEAKSIGQYLFLFNSPKDDDTSSALSPLVFTFDRKKRVLSDDEMMVVNPNDWFYYIVEKYRTPSLSPQKDELTSKVPKAPLTFDAFMLQSQETGKYTVSVRLSSENINGEPLSTKRLYYEFIKQDGTIYEFTPEFYPPLESDMSVIPYSYLEANVIYGINNARNFVAILPGDTDFGCRMIYRDETGSYKSNILWAVAGEDKSGVKAITEKIVVKEEWFDLTGHKVLNPGNGLYICRKYMSDGSLQTTKIAR